MLTERLKTKHMNSFLRKLIRKQITEESSSLSREIFGLSGDAYDVLHIARMKAAWDSADYYSQHMVKSIAVASKFELLTRGMSIRPAGGLLLEFGVASGKTINFIAKQTNEPVFGFDSFQGLPEDWRTGYSAGRYAQKKPDVGSNVQLVEGLFESTIPSFLSDHRNAHISLVHVDCDLYSSTKTILEILRPRLIVGTVLVFDEYFNYPGWQHHEQKAFAEFCDEWGIAYRYDSFVPSHQQVCVQISDIH